MLAPLPKSASFTIQFRITDSTGRSLDELQNFSDYISYLPLVQADVLNDKILKE